MGWHEAAAVVAEEAREAVRWWWRTFLLIWPWLWRGTAILVVADLVWRMV